MNNTPRTRRKIEKHMKKVLNGFIETIYNPKVLDLNKRIQELEAKLEKTEQLGARMASALYNVRQSGFHINDHDREVMGELVSEWDQRKS